MPSVIFSGSKVKALKKILSLNGGAEIHSGTTDPTSSAVDAPAGTIYQHETTGALYRKLDSGSSTNWAIVPTAAGNLAITSKTSNYTATSSDDVILCDSSGGTFTITLPAAASNSGKNLYIKKTDTSLTAVTIDGNASETIDAQTTTTINTQGEALRIISDGSNWQILERRIPSQWSTSLTFTPANFGTITAPTYYWRRAGDSLEARLSWANGTVVASAARLDLPSGIVIDSTKANGTGGSTARVGEFTTLVVGPALIQNTDKEGVIFYDNSDTDSLFFSIQTSSRSFEKNTANGISSSSDNIEVRFTIPVVGWKG